MIWITATQLQKSFGEHVVLSDVSFELRQGEHVGLIGRNGSGKSTLFRLLCGQMQPDGGTLSVAPGLRMEVLEQIPHYPEGTTVEQVMRTGFAPLRDMEAQLAALREQMEQDASPALLQSYDRLHARYESEGGYEQDLSFARVATGLHLEEQFLARPFEALSGGEKTKVNLARIMLANPDILLLDEPTNHLDMASIEWTEEFLFHYKGTVLLISHDRTFLDSTVNRIMELEYGKITDYAGNYSEYMDYKEQLAELQQRHYEREQKEIKRLETVSTRLLGWGIQTERLSRAALSMRKRIARLRENQTQRMRQNNRRIRASLDDGGRSGFDVLSLKDVAVGYDGKKLLEHVSFELKKGERVALLGDNGAGKTTLFKLLCGELPAMEGRVKWGANVKVGLMPQNLVFEHPERTLLDTLLWERPGLTAQMARDRLASYDFLGEEVFKLVADLSGGERARLKHCLLSFEPINLFLLDEPTNHLDIPSREWVESVLEEYEGTLLFISHDRYFISRMASRILTVEQGTVHDFRGGFEAYQQAREARRQTAAPAAPKAPTKEAAEAKAPADGGRALSPLRQERTLQRRQAACEKEIAALEQQLLQLKEEMERSMSDYEALFELTQRQAALETQLEELYEQWSGFAEQLEALESEKEKEKEKEQ